MVSLRTRSRCRFREAWVLPLSLKGVTTGDPFLSSLSFPIYKMQNIFCKVVWDSSEIMYAEVHINVIVLFNFGLVFWYLCLFGFWPCIYLSLRYMGFLNPHLPALFLNSFCVHSDIFFFCLLGFCFTDILISVCRWFANEWILTVSIYFLSFLGNSSENFGYQSFALTHDCPYVHFSFVTIYMWILRY